MKKKPLAPACWSKQNPDHTEINCKSFKTITFVFKLVYL